jgi:putative nucleotidyltransferase with HDIG domain
MKRVLFVDNISSDLEAYKQNFQFRDEEWQTFFAEDSSSALKILINSSIDIVISEINIPLVSGEQFLDTVKLQWPKVVRIIISRDSASTNLAAVAASHRFLDKSESIEKIEEAVNSIYYLQRIVLSDQTRLVASKLEVLPSLPHVYNDLLNEINSPEPSIGKIGKLIASDVGMSADILRMVNSPYFGLRQSVGSPEQAVPLLGLEIVKGLLLSARLFRSFTISDRDMKIVERVVEHSLVVANFAKKILELENVSKELIDLSFTAGVLHDVGYLIFASSFSTKFHSAIEVSDSLSQPLWEVEQDMIGTTHGEVGAYLLGLWGLPDSVIEAVAFHHTPSKSQGDSSMILCALHQADLFCDEIFPDLNIGNPGEIDYSFLERMQISSKREIWRDACFDYASSSYGGLDNK